MDAVFRSRSALALALLPLGVLVGCNGGGGGSGSLINTNEAGCLALGNLAAQAQFPVSNTSITLARFNASGTTTANSVALPEIVALSTRNEPFASTIPIAGVPNPDDPA